MSKADKVMKTNCNILLIPYHFIQFSLNYKNIILGMLIFLFFFT